MKRSDIHADGTIYAYQPHIGHAVPARVVETDRFWTKSLRYVGPATITMEHATVPSRTSDPGTVRRYAGFLIVAATGKYGDNPETLALLAAMELKAPENTGDFALWQSLLPEGLDVHIVVSRDLLDPWGIYVVARDRQRVEEKRAREQRDKDYQRAHAARARAQELMKEFGLRENHAPASGRATVQVDAEQLADLLYRFKVETELGDESL